MLNDIFPGLNSFRRVACLLACSIPLLSAPVAAKACFLKANLKFSGWHLFQRVTDQGASGSAGEVPHGRPKMDSRDQKTNGPVQHRRTRGLERKGSVQRDPEKIPAEGQRDLIDIMKPKQN